MGDENDTSLEELLDNISEEIDDINLNGYPNTYDTTITGTDYSPSYSWAMPQDEITVPESGDVKIGNRSLKEFMDKVESRLAILTPDSKKLEKFAALRKAYEHYKTLESLCELEEEENEDEDIPF